MRSYRLRSNLVVQNWADTWSGNNLASLTKGDLVVFDPTSDSYFRFDLKLAPLLEKLSGESFSNEIELSSSIIGVSRDFVSKGLREMDRYLLLEQKGSVERWERLPFIPLRRSARQNTDLVQLYSKVSLERKRNDFRVDHQSRDWINHVLSLVEKGDLSSAMSVAESTYSHSNQEIMKQIALVISQAMGTEDPVAFALESFKRMGINRTRGGDGRGAADPLENSMTEFGLYLIQTARYREARSVFQRVLSIFPKSLRALTLNEQLERVLIDPENPKGFLAFLNGVIELRCGPTLIRFLRGLSSLRLLDWAPLGLFTAVSLSILWQSLQFSQFELQRLSEVSAAGLVFAFAYLLIAVSAHEAAHAAICLRYGGAVLRWGFRFILGAPSVFFDCSSSWLFKEKRQRLHLLIAGPVVDLIFLALSLVAIRYGENRSAGFSFYGSIGALISGVMVIGNLNPFIRYDGYFILCELLGEPRLKEMDPSQFGSGLKRVLVQSYQWLAKAYIGVLVLSFWFAIAVGVYWLGGAPALASLCLLTVLPLVLSVFGGHKRRVSWLFSSWRANARRVRDPALVNYLGDLPFELLGRPRFVKRSSANLFKRSVVEGVSALGPPLDLFLSECGFESWSQLQLQAEREVNKGVLIGLQTQLSVSAQSVLPHRVFSESLQILWPESKDSSLSPDRIFKALARLGAPRSLILRARREFKRDLTTLTREQVTNLVFYLAAERRLAEIGASRQDPVLRNARLNYTPIPISTLSIHWVGQFGPKAAGGFLNEMTGMLLPFQGGYFLERLSVLQRSAATGAVTRIFCEDRSKAERVASLLQGIQLNSDETERLKSLQDQLMRDCFDLGAGNRSLLMQWRKLSEEDLDELRMSLLTEREIDSLFGNWLKIYSARDLELLGWLVRLEDGKRVPFLRGPVLVFPIQDPVSGFRFPRVRAIRKDSTLQMVLRTSAGQFLSRSQKYLTQVLHPALLGVTQCPEAQLFPTEEKIQGTDGRVFIVEGEIKAHLARKVFGKDFRSIQGIGWPDFTFLFPLLRKTGAREIVLCMDRDDPSLYAQPRLDGQTDSDRFTALFGSLLSDYCEAHFSGAFRVRVMDLPCDSAASKKIDIESFALQARDGGPDAAARIWGRLESNTVTVEEFILRRGIRKRELVAAYRQFLERYTFTLRSYGQQTGLQEFRSVPEGNENTADPIDASKVANGRG